ncbi:MAG TPA: transposase, partial [Spirochaetota bacterium]|nr:transposase [Spirochaetota bacterium]
TLCNKKINLSSKIKKQILVDFDGGNITGDAGIIIVKQIDTELKISKKMSDSIKDTRDQSKIEHTLEHLLQQRIYQILLGYQDCNDANTLRNDPIFKTVIDKLPESDIGLAGQSTLSRLENMVGISDIHALTSLMVDIYTHKSIPCGI